MIHSIIYIHNNQGIYINDLSQCHEAKNLNSHLNSKLGAHTYQQKIQVSFLELWHRVSNRTLLEMDTCKSSTTEAQRPFKEPYKIPML